MEILQVKAVNSFIGVKKLAEQILIVYKKTGNKLYEIGRNAFRVKRLPAPTFKIGPYGIVSLF